jgi:hypothetical protein
VHKEGVIDVTKLRPRPTDEFSPDDEDEDDGGRRNKLDKLELAIRTALYRSSTSSSIRQFLKDNLKPLTSDALKLAEFVDTDYKYDF